MNRLQIRIETENDVLLAGSEIWKLCKDLCFSNLEAMQVRTATSELARNILKYAGRGEVLVRSIENNGLKLVFLDRGPGIADIESAMQYGFSTANSLGLGLPGSKKLADRFEIQSAPGKGTQVTFVKYPRNGTSRPESPSSARPLRTHGSAAPPEPGRARPWQRRSPGSGAITPFDDPAAGPPARRR